MKTKVHLPVAVAMVMLVVSSCDLIKMKRGQEEGGRKVIARLNDAQLYADELKGILPGKTTAADSAARIGAYVNNWIRKQLLINEALKSVHVDEAEIERKVADYRNSLVTYEFLNYYIRENLSDSVDAATIEEYYKTHTDNFILKQNIIQGSFIKVPKDAPRTQRIRELMFSTKEKEMAELRSYCLGFSSAFHLSDSTWIEFDKVVVNSPLADIPNKIQFLRSYNYYETSDAGFLYFLKVDAYKIIDNISPLAFVRQDIKNIILNKRKVELAKKLEDDIYENAAKKKEFEVFGQ